MSIYWIIIFGSVESVLCKLDDELQRKPLDGKSNSNLVLDVLRLIEGKFFRSPIVVLVRGTRPRIQTGFLGNIFENILCG